MNKILVSFIAIVLLAVTSIKGQDESARRRLDSSIAEKLNEEYLKQIKQEIPLKLVIDDSQCLSKYTDEAVKEWLENLRENKQTFSNDAENKIVFNYKEDDGPEFREAVECMKEALEAFRVAILTNKD